MNGLVDWLAGLPVVVTFLVLAAFWVLLAVLVVWGGNRLIDPEAREEAKDSLYRVLAVVSSFYAFLVGFVIVQEWQNTTTARQQIAQEAAALTTAGFDASGLPGGAFRPVSDALVDYDRTLVCIELPGLRTQEDPSPETTAALEHVYKTVVGLPAAATSAPTFGNVLGAVDDAASARRARLAAASERVPGVLLAVLLLVGVLLVLVASAQSVKNGRAHYLSVIIAALFVALGQGLVVELARPFAGSATVSDAPLRVGVPPDRLRCTTAPPASAWRPPNDESPA